MISQLEVIEFLIVGTVSKHERDCASLHLTWLRLFFFLLSNIAVDKVQKKTILKI